VYICLCNALTDKQVRQAVADGASRPRDVYGACGCRAQCGTCARAVLASIRDAAAVLAPPVGGRAARPTPSP
jgi:bacterioferritin-associated ferredoxin